MAPVFLYVFQVNLLECGIMAAEKGPFSLTYKGI